MFSNFVLRKNSLFQKFKNMIDANKIYYIEGDYMWGRKFKLNRLKKKTSLAVLPIMILAIKQK